MAEKTFIELKNQNVLLNTDEIPFWRTATGVSSRISFSELKSALAGATASLPMQELTINSASAQLDFNQYRVFELSIDSDTTIDALQDTAYFQEGQVYYMILRPSASYTISFNGTRFSIPDITTDQPLGIVIIPITDSLAVAMTDPSISTAISGLKDGVPVEGDTLNKLYNLIQGTVGVSATADDIADRDSQAPLNDQQNIYVADASADPSVTSGWAIYKYITSTSSFVKIAEEENLDVNAALVSDITVNVGGEDVGGIEDAQVLASGTTLQQFAEALLRKAIPPTYVQPELDLAVSGAILGEVGDQLNVTITPTFTQNDGGVATEYRVTKDAASLVVDNSAPIPEASYADTLTFVDGDIVYDSEMDHDQGAVKNDNLGDPDATGQIAAGTVGSEAKTFTGVFPWFFGVSADGVIANIDVYADGTKVIEQIGDFIDANFATDGFLWFAVHKTSNNPKVYSQWERIDYAINKGEVGSSSDLFAAAVTKQVASSGLSADWTEDYDLYITNYSTTAFNARFK